MTPARDPKQGFLLTLVGIFAMWRNHGEGIMQEEQWRRTDGGGIISEAAGDPPGKHLRGIWEASGKHSGGIWRGIWGDLDGRELQEVPGRSEEKKLIHL